VEPTATEPNEPQSTWAHSPGGELQGEESGFSDRADLADELLEDGVAAGVALGLELLEELAGGVGMTFEQGGDMALEAVELAGARSLGPRLVLGLVDPLLDGLGIEVKGLGDLGDFESLLIMELAQAAEGLVVDHGRPPSRAWRRMSPTLRAWPLRGAGG
jgi:hypothetical protein